MDNSSNTIVPIYNVPNLKQGQNGVEVALAIYKIIVDVKAHLPGPKEVAVRSSIVVVTCLLFDDCHFSSNKQWLLLGLYYLFMFSNKVVS